MKGKSRYGAAVPRLKPSGEAVAMLEILPFGNSRWPANRGGCKLRDANVKNPLFSATRVSCSSK